MAKNPGRVGLAIKRISYQFQDTPLHRLMLGVVATAIDDLEKGNHPYASENQKRIGRQAKRYLLGEIIHAQLCGVDPEWIRDTLRTLGLLERA